MKEIALIGFVIASIYACNTTVKDTDSEKKATNDSVAIIADKDESDTVIKAISPDQLITPGKGIGHILLGEDQAKAIEQLGKPDFGDAAMGSSLVTWYANHDSSSYQTSIFSGRNFGAKDENIAHIKKILVTSPWFNTAEKIGVGSTLHEIKQSFTVHTNNQLNRGIKTFTDKSKGISFEINNEDKCVGIIVHNTNEEAGTYLDMHQK